MVRRSVMFRKTDSSSRCWPRSLLVLLLGLAGCGGTGGTPLKLQLKAGQSYTYDLAMTMKGSVQGPGTGALDGLIPEDGSVRRA